MTRALERGFFSVLALLEAGYWALKELSRLIVICHRFTQSGFPLDRNQLIAQLVGLTFDFFFESLLPLRVAGGPQGFVLFDWFGDEGVKNESDFMCGRRGGGWGAELGRHAAQIGSQGCGTALQRIGRHAEDLPGSMLYRAQASPRYASVMSLSGH
jgi:hypothetical protein